MVYIPRDCSDIMIGKMVPIALCER